MRTRLLAFSLLIAVSASAGEHFPYVFKLGTGQVLHIRGSIESFRRIERRWSGDFLWLEHGGRQYLIREASVLAEAARAFEPLDALEPQNRAAQDRLRPLEKKYETLEKRHDELSDGDDEDPAVQRQIRDAERALQSMKVQLDAAERASERLEQEMERRETIAERKLEQIVLRAIAAGKARRVD